MPLKRLPPRIATAAPQRGWNTEGRPTAAERGYGWAWQKLRERIMVRDHGLCQPCKRRGLVTLARDVDHIVPKDQGGDDSPANLQAICSGPGSCHAAKTRVEARGLEWDEAQFKPGDKPPK